MKPGRHHHERIGLSSRMAHMTIVPTLTAIKAHDRGQCGASGRSAVPIRPPMMLAQIAAKNRIMHPVLALLFSAVTALSACAVPELPPVVIPEPVAVVEPESPPPAANHAPAAAAVKEYRKAEKAEAQAVTKPTATAASIANIHEANKLARKAADELVKMNGQPTAAGIARARRTLDDLIRALEASP
jgi:hypothetical protein